MRASWLWKDQVHIMSYWP